MDDRDHLFTAIKVWAAAAWADGAIAPAEAMAMRAIIEIAKLDEPQRKTARGWIDHKVSLDDVDVGKIPSSDRLHIFQVACGVAAIDKDVAAAEKSFLDRLAKALAINDTDAAKAKKAAGLT